MNIMFTCAGRRTYLLNYFKEQLGNEGLIVGADMQPTAPALAVADVAILLPGLYDSSYIDTLLERCRKQSIDVLISLNDLELPLLAANCKKLEAFGMKVLVSSQNIIDICSDKQKTARFISSIGLQTPLTYCRQDEAMKALKEGVLKFPLIMKPRWGSGSIGIETVHDMQEFQLIYSYLNNKIRQSILSEISEDENSILIQQKITGKEYGLDIMNDLTGRLVAVSVKEKLAMRAGETDKAKTVDNKALEAIGRHIGTQLGHVANLDCDIMEQDGEYYVLELNPRFGGGFPFTYEAGGNLPKAIIEWAKGNDVSPTMLQVTPGLTFAKCDILVRR